MSIAPSLLTTSAGDVVGIYMLVLLPVPVPTKMLSGPQHHQLHFRSA
jgi:hypothetical protein